MSGWTAVVPIKPAGERKSRLALPPAALTALTDAMLAHVLATLAHTPAIREVALLARDRPAGWRGGWFADEGGGLNGELARVARLLGGPLVVLHADLPVVTPDDVAALIAAAEDGAAIAPDRHARGTNALALAASRDAGFAFGADSHARHRAAFPGARIVMRAGLALDIDDADDLAEARRRGCVFPGETGVR